MEFGKEGIEQMTLLSLGLLWGRSGLLSAKGGLMMGTKKVGALPSPHKRTIVIITQRFNL